MSSRALESAAAGGPSDAELVARVLEGEKERYSVLVQRHQDRLYRHALGMVQDRDAAADLVQDTFLKAYASLRRCGDPSRFGGWLFRILQNKCRDYRKDLRRKSVPLEEGTVLAPRRDEPAYEFEHAALSEAVSGALASLPELLREAFLLKHVDGLSYEEMGELLGASKSALKMRVLRARETLQASLRDTLAADG